MAALLLTLKLVSIYLDGFLAYVKTYSVLLPEGNLSIGEITVEKVEHINYPKAFLADTLIHVTVCCKRQIKSHRLEYV